MSDNICTAKTHQCIDFTGMFAMNNIAIITARSGSKGLINKNIRFLAGKPLIAYSIEAAVDTQIFSEIMVSTDSVEYANISRQYGAKVPFLRSAAMSSNNASNWDVIKEVLHNYLELGRRFDTVCLLQPTSPLRKAEDIIKGYKELEEKKADAITAVCEMDHSPLWCMALDETLSLEEYRKFNVDHPRQSLKTYYRINGALYIRRIEYMEGNIIIQDKNEYAYIMDRNRSVDIDTIEDFEYAEFSILKK